MSARHDQDSDAHLLAVLTGVVRAGVRASFGQLAQGSPSAVDNTRCARGRKPRGVRRDAATEQNRPGSVFRQTIFAGSKPAENVTPLERRRIAGRPPQRTHSRVEGHERAEAAVRCEREVTGHERQGAVVDGASGSHVRRDQCRWSNQAHGRLGWERFDLLAAFCRAGDLVEAPARIERRRNRRNLRRRNERPSHWVGEVFPHSESVAANGRSRSRCKPLRRRVVLDDGQQVWRRILDRHGSAGHRTGSRSHIRYTRYGFDQARAPVPVQRLHRKRKLPRDLLRRRAWTAGWVDGLEVHR